MAATIAAIAGGHLADRLNPRMVFAAGCAAYVAGYAVFALDQHAWPVLLIGFLLAGMGIGFAETAESTVVALMLPDHLRGNGYGVLGLVQSMGALAASLVVGLLWAAFTPTLAFGYAAAWMLAGALAARLITTTTTPVPPESEHVDDRGAHDELPPGTPAS